MPCFTTTKNKFGIISNTSIHPDTSVMTTSTQPLLSVVVPAYKEQDVLPAFHKRLTKALADPRYAIEIVYVNDGRPTIPWPSWNPCMLLIPVSHWSI